MFFNTLRVTAQPSLLTRIIFLCGLHSIAIADVAGQVTAVVGQVEIISGNATRSVFKGDLIHDGETIDALNDDSKVQMMLSDGTVIIVHPSTQLEIESYAFERNKPENNKSHLRLNKGSIRAINGEIAKHTLSNAQLSTPIGILKFKQSDYSATLNDNSLIVTVQQGSIDFNNSLGQTTVNQGQSFQFSTQSPALLTQAVALDSFVLPNPPKKSTTSNNGDKNRPRLEDFSNYNKFLQAMYLYRKAAEDKIKPRIIINNLPNGQLKLEQSTIEGEYDITQWDNQIRQIVAKIDTLTQPPLAQDNSNSLHMNLLSSLEMEYASIDNALDQPSFLLSDIIDLNDKELSNLLKLEPLEDSEEKKKKEELLVYLLKKSLRLNTEGNDIRIIGAELGQPEINVISRP